MSWIQRYNLRHYVRNSVWILPVFAIVAALVLVRSLRWIEEGAGWQFDLMDMPTLFAMKSALLLKRSRSRDYFDLMLFCQHGKTLADIMAAAQVADGSPEVPTVVEHKLLGLLPLDADDEGLDPVGVDVTPADIYRFFEGLVQQQEVAIARDLLISKRSMEK